LASSAQWLSSPFPGTQHYRHLVSIDPGIRSELFGWSVVETTVQGQSALLRSVLQEFLTTLAEKEEHYGLEPKLME